MSERNYYPTYVVIPIYSVFTGVGIALTALRTWVRVVYTRSPLGTDDYLMYLALAGSAGCIAIQYWNALDGNDGAAASDPDSDAKSVLIEHQVDWAEIIIEKIGFGAVKLSILFFYRRIFGIWSSFRLLNNILIYFVGVWAFVFCLSDILICGSHAELNIGADQTLAREKCGSRGAQLLAFSATSVATDFFILLLPFFYLRRLQMARDKKLATAFVFLLGTTSLAASIIRLIFLIVSYPEGRLEFAYVPPPASETPLVLEIFNPAFWALTELWLALWAANLPPCGPLLKELKVHPYRILNSIYHKRSQKSLGLARDRALPRAIEDLPSRPKAEKLTFRHSCWRIFRFFNRSSPPMLSPSGPAGFIGSQTTFVFQQARRNAITPNIACHVEALMMEKGIINPSPRTFYVATGPLMAIVSNSWRNCPSQRTVHDQVDK
ncbi:hypothetical protein F5Y16DRAFT_409295 [Xylariaceae sp. FL0255]|nr:hypothetical protein F5Y16DRAFT_409295 [Xylariaceae sp. FL0255]